MELVLKIALYKVIMNKIINVLIVKQIVLDVISYKIIYVWNVLINLCYYKMNVLLVLILKILLLCLLMGIVRIDVVMVKNSIHGKLLI